MAFVRSALGSFHDSRQASTPPLPLRLSEFRHFIFVISWFPSLPSKSVAQTGVTIPKHMFRGLQTRPNSHLLAREASKTKTDMYKFAPRSPRRANSGRFGARSYLQAYYYLSMQRTPCNPEGQSQLQLQKPVLRPTLSGLGPWRAQTCLWIATGLTTEKSSKSCGSHKHIGL